MLDPEPQNGDPGRPLSLAQKLDHLQSRDSATRLWPGGEPTVTSHMQRAPIVLDPEQLHEAEEGGLPSVLCKCALDTRRQQTRSSEAGHHLLCFASPSPHLWTLVPADVMFLF